MEFALRSGRARAIGVSNYEVKHLVEIMDLEEKPAVNQVEWHPYHHDDELKAFCHQNAIALEAWSPLSGRNASAEKAEHMKTDLEVFSFQLSAAEMQSISKLKVSEVFV
ncbi:unnamed protein product [Durusdinium trenchii]|uniref:NADP-dependent oxidoreductase domain-containing protein n=1 Tax=Durusdinium trenchii TaxID=1381693 RepID=A0ABP0Q9F0_9DINO